LNAKPPFSSGVIAFEHFHSPYTGSVLQEEKLQELIRLAATVSSQNRHRLLPFHLKNWYAAATVSSQKLAIPQWGL
jgi:hypothetical protein